MKSDVAVQVIELVHEISGIPTVKLRNNRDFVINRSISGDDAVELIEAFVKSFEVDMMHYEHRRYFGPEGGDPFSIIFYAIRSIWRLSHVPLTIGELISIAENKVWPQIYSGSE